MKKIILVFIAIFTLFANSNKALAYYDFGRRDCPTLIEMESWNYEKTIRGEEYYARHQSWFNENGSIDESGDLLYLDKKRNSHSIKNDPQNPRVLVYIGPWQKVTLTKGSFFHKEKTEVEIRMIASQRGKILENYYEIKDDLNSKIPEQKFIPLEEPEDLIAKCDILRAQKWGYNAVADYHVNIFRAYLGKSILGGSGKIIDSETDEVIADETGKLIKTKD